MAPRKANPKTITCIITIPFPWVKVVQAALGADGKPWESLQEGQMPLIVTPVGNGCIVPEQRAQTIGISDSFSGLTR